MASYGDLEAFRQAMKETRDDWLKRDGLTQRWVGSVSIAYIPGEKVWSAVFDCDLGVRFNEIRFSSSDLYLYIDGIHVANFCHKHQMNNLYNSEE